MTPAPFSVPIKGRCSPPRVWLSFAVSLLSLHDLLPALPVRSKDSICPGDAGHECRQRRGQRVVDTSIDSRRLPARGGSSATPGGRSSQESHWLLFGCGASGWCTRAEDQDRQAEHHASAPVEDLGFARVVPVHVGVDVSTAFIGAGVAVSRCGVQHGDLRPPVPRPVAVCSHSGQGCHEVGAAADRPAYCLQRRHAHSVHSGQRWNGTRDPR